MMRFRVSAAGLAFAIALYSGTVLAAEVADVPLDAVAEATPLYVVTPPGDFPDVKLTKSGEAGGQSVAVNPKNANVFVAAYANQGSCWVRTSTDAGQAWAAAKKLPMPPGKPNCNIASLFWAADGSRVYAAYNYFEDVFDSQEIGAIISSSNDKGFTWSSPKIALRYPPYQTYTIRSLRLSTPLRTSDANWVYLLSELGNQGGGETEFTRSADGGRTWSPKQSLLGHDDQLGGESRPSLAGGLGGDVLVAWGEYHYDVDGNFLGQQIYLKYSKNYGGAFSADMVAVPDTYGDTAVAFGSGGTAHLVYMDGYNGKPSYVYSTKAPYTAWSKPGYPRSGAELLTFLVESAM